MDSKILPEKSLYQSLLSKINPDIFTDTVMLGELHGHDWIWVFYPRQNKIVPIEKYRKKIFSRKR